MVGEDVEAAGRHTGGFSPDGKWIAYGINRSNGNNELRVTNVASGAVKTTAFGSQAAFSTDSHWLAFSIGYSETQAERMRTENRPVRNKLGLMNLASGDQTVIDDIESFSFSPTGAWLAMRQYPPERAGECRRRSRTWRRGRNRWRRGQRRPGRSRRYRRRREHTRSDPCSPPACDRTRYRSRQCFGIRMAGLEASRHAARHGDFDGG